MKDSYSILEFTSTFTDEYCFNYLLNVRFPNGLACVFCGAIDPYLCKSRNKDYFPSFKCRDKHCHKKFSITVGTIFQGTMIPLRTWFYNANSINTKNISSHQIGKNLGLTQCSAWKCQSKLRSILTQDDLILSGIIEVDEAFSSKWSRLGKWGGKIITRKAPIFGLIERGGKVILKVVQDRSRGSLIPIIQKHVEKGSTIYTDGFYGYKVLDQDYLHDCVEHSAKEYVRGEVHTNTIENVWSFFKKNIRNAHHAVSIKHLQSYLDETAFKFNNRDLSQMERFDLILKKCIL